MRAKFALLIGAMLAAAVSGVSRPTVVSAGGCSDPCLGLTIGDNLVAGQPATVDATSGSQVLDGTRSWNFSVQGPGSGSATNVTIKAQSGYPPSSLGVNSLPVSTSAAVLGPNQSLDLPLSGPIPVSFSTGFDSSRSMSPAVIPTGGGTQVVRVTVTRTSSAACVTDTPGFEGCNFGGQVFVNLPGGAVTTVGAPTNLDQSEGFSSSVQSPMGQWSMNDPILNKPYTITFTLTLPDLGHPYFYKPQVALELGDSGDHGCQQDVCPGPATSVTVADATLDGPTPGSGQLTFSADQSVLWDEGGRAPTAGVGYGELQASAAAGRSFAANAGGNSITEYAAGADGNAVPVTTISGPHTRLNDPHAVALGPDGTIYVANATGYTITEYAPDSQGDVAPIRTIAGVSTGLGYPSSVALDSAGNLYVANPQAGYWSVTEYAPGADGNAPPIHTISGSNTGFNFPYNAVLDARGTIYVANNTGQSIAEFPAGTSGNVAPVRTISGSLTGLNRPYGLALDDAGNLYVSNLLGNSITKYPPGASGDVAPSAVITGPATGLNLPYHIAMDVAGVLYVANDGDHAFSITEYAPGASGNSAPVRTITGGNTGLANSVGIAVAAIPVIPTKTSLATSADPASPGATVTYTASVSPAPAAGSVTFFADGTTIAGCVDVPLSSLGQAGCSVVYTATGNHLVSATYNAVSPYVTSASPLLGETVASCGSSPAGCNLQGATMQNAWLAGVSFQGANLKGATLTGSNLSGANLSGANLLRASLAGADLTGADLRGANLHGANLSNAILARANLAGANLHGALLTGAVWSGTTCPDGSISDNDGGTCAHNL